jgi:hypothetical protein
MQVMVKDQVKISDQRFCERFNKEINNLIFGWNIMERNHRVGYLFPQEVILDDYMLGFGVKAKIL